MSEVQVDRTSSPAAERFAKNLESRGVTIVAPPRVGIAGMPRADYRDEGARQSVRVQAREQSAKPAPSAAPDPREATHIEQQVRASDPRAVGMMRANADQGALAKLTELKMKTPVAEQTTSWKSRWMAAWVNVLEGRPSNYKPGAVVAAVVPAAAAPAATGDGWFPISAYGPAHLSGYTLPNFLGERQMYHQSTVTELAKARQLGLSQDQVNSYIRAQMVKDKWLPA